MIRRVSAVFVAAALLSTGCSGQTPEAKQAAADYLQRAAQEPGAVQTESGLVFRTLTPGTGAQPKATDEVRVH